MDSIQQYKRTYLLHNLRIPKALLGTVANWLSSAGLQVKDFGKMMWDESGLGDRSAWKGMISDLQNFGWVARNDGSGVNLGIVAPAIIAKDAPTADLKYLAQLEKYTKNLGLLVSSPFKAALGAIENSNFLGIDRLPLLKALKANTPEEARALEQAIRGASGEIAEGEVSYALRLLDDPDYITKIRQARGKTSAAKSAEKAKAKRAEERATAAARNEKKEWKHASDVYGGTQSVGSEHIITKRGGNRWTPSK